MLRTARRGKPAAIVGVASILTEPSIGREPYWRLPHAQSE
jgi:hypothetical protein